MLVVNDEAALDRAPVQRWEPAVFMGALLLGLIGTFRFTYFSSWDGPAHAASAYGFSHYGGAIETVFRRDWFPSPNLGAHIYESVLIPLLGPARADRVVAATCVTAVALGTRYLCRSVSPDTGRLVSYIGLPIAFGWFVHGGQYSFLLGVASATSYLGWRFRSATGDGWTRSGWISAAVLVWLYLCHLVPFAIVVLIHLLVAVPYLRARRWRRVITDSVCLAPATALLVAYLSRGGAGGSQRRTLKDLVADAVTLREVLVAFSTRHEFVPLSFAIGAIAFVVGAGVIKRRQLASSPAARIAAMAALMLAALYWVVPTNLSGGGFLTARFALFAIILASAAASASSPRLMRVVPIIALASMLGMVVVRQHQYGAFSDDIQELMEARPYVGSDKVVLTLMMCSERDPGCASATASAIAPLSEASGFLMANTGAADVTLYEAYFKFFPMQFRARTTPADRLFLADTDTADAPPAVDVAAYERITGVKIDVIVLWGWSAVSGDATITRLNPLRAALSDYHDVHTSARGHVTVLVRT